MTSVSLSAQQSNDSAANGTTYPAQRIGTNESRFDQQTGEYTQPIAQTAAITALNPRVAKMSRKLNNIDWQTFEQKIVDLWGAHLKASAEDEQGSRVRIIIPGEQEMKNQMVIDRVNNAITFEGNPHDAENWEALISILDNTEETEFSHIHLVGLGTASPTTIRKAVALLGLPEEESGSLADSMRFAPFRNADRDQPQRRGQLRSIPFQPAGTKNQPAAATGPRARRQPTPAPTTPTPPRVSNNRPSSVTPLPNSTSESAAAAPARSTTARISNASSGTGASNPFTRAATARKLVPNEASNQPGSEPVGGNPAASVLTGNAPSAIRPKPAKPATPTLAKPTRMTPVARQEEINRNTDIVPLVQDDQEANGKVTIQMVEGMNTIVLIGAAEDVARVQAIIRQIVEQAETNAPISKVRMLKNSDSAELKETLDAAYTVHATSNGPVEIVALTNPSRLFIQGQESGLKIVEGLIDQLDQEPPRGEESTSDYVLHRLKFISARDAADRLEAYFTTTDANATAGFQNQLDGILASAGPISVVIDFRANALLIKGNQRVQSTAKGILEALDVDESEATHVVRFFPVFNAVASDIATILQEAVNGGFDGVGPIVNAPNAQNNANAAANANALGQNRVGTRPVTALQLTTIDESGETVRSGILLEVRFSADTNSNQIMVTGPEKSMDLVAALIEQLDKIPDAETQIKVFTILNGDATELLTTLQTIFGAGQQQPGGVNNAQGIAQLPLQSLSGSRGASLINLNFAVDTRTNSILATGPAGDLEVIEDLLNRLDERDLRLRTNRIYRLLNAPAQDVADAISTWLTDRQAIFDADPTTSNGLVSARRQVVVVPELVTNSLIISALPEYFEEVITLIEGLDRRPAMVKIKVLIAEVSLDKLSEFGVEVGIQDSLLFDRGLGTIGFPFNQGGIGNGAIFSREMLAGQGLSNLGVGRTSADAGFGGLVLSAGNESISILMRALQDRGVARVLSTPDITTVDNLQARIQVGQTVGRIRGTDQGNNLAGTISTDVEDVAVGVILQVTPRVSPDGMIIMSVDATNSSLGSDADGVPVFANGTMVINSPPINIVQAQTTIMARSGQTVAFSGLIQDDVQETKRGTPILSDLPVIGPLFSFETKEHSRNELLIILTPYLIDSDAALEASNQMSYSRMNWCVDDVASVYGNIDGYDSEFQESAAAMTIYPDQDPLGNNPEYLPLEESQPTLDPAHQEYFDQPFSNPADALPQVPSASPSPSDVNPQGSGLLPDRTLPRGSGSR